MSRRVSTGVAYSPGVSEHPEETLARALIALLALLLAAACSTGAPASTAQPMTLTRFEVTLTDPLRMEPAAMTVPIGVPVTFVVTNLGAIDHEFYLGDETAQSGHEQEMQSMGGMMHDEPAGIALDPGQTKELTFTFVELGATLAGCHVTGHYAAGMKAAITVAAR